MSRRYGTRLRAGLEGIMIYEKNTDGIPSLSTEEEIALRAAEDAIDAQLKAKGGETTFSFDSVRPHVPGLTPMVWRVLLRMYEDAGYEVIKFAPGKHDDTIWKLRYTPRAQKR
jgi:hypothetical protein